MANIEEATMNIEVVKMEEKEHSEEEAVSVAMKMAVLHREENTHLKSQDLLHSQ